MTPIAQLLEPSIRSMQAQKQVLHRVTPKWTASPVAPRLLFADVLLEVDSAEKHRRRWAAVSTLVLQSLLIAAVLIVPLMFTSALPTAQFVTFLVAPPPPAPPPPPAAAAPVKVIRQVISEVLDSHLRAPSRIPQKIAMIKEDEAPPAIFPGGVIGGVPGGQLGGVIGGIISSVPHTAVVPKLVLPEPARRIRVSQGVSQGQSIYSPEPIYPRIARDARVQGVVILRAIISKTGEIQNLEVVAGHPMLVPAAIQAVKQWRYRPFLLSGEAVEVETAVTVSFHLSL